MAGYFIERNWVTRCRNCDTVAAKGTGVVVVEAKLILFERVSEKRLSLTQWSCPIGGTTAGNINCTSSSSSSSSIRDHTVIRRKQRNNAGPWSNNGQAPVIRTETVERTTKIAVCSTLGKTRSSTLPAMVSSFFVNLSETVVSIIKTVVRQHEH